MGGDLSSIASFWPYRKTANSQGREISVVSRYSKSILLLSMAILMTLGACTFNFTPGPPVAPQTAIPSSTPIVLSSSTPEPTNTSSPTTVPTATIEPSLTPDPPAQTPASFAPRVDVENPAYQLQPGSPVTLPSFTTGCGWMGVAGQVFATETETVPLLVVQIGGTLQGEEFLGLSLTGTARQYGPGGYEIVLADRTFASDNTLWMQIFDLDGNPLSNQVYFNTFSDCQRNLILINFISSALSPDYKEFFYFPLVLRNGNPE